MGLLGWRLASGSGGTAPLGWIYGVLLPVLRVRPVLPGLRQGAACYSAI